MEREKYSVRRVGSGRFEVTNLDGWGNYTEDNMALNCSTLAELLNVPKVHGYRLLNQWTAAVSI
jgi:hypothetical protein